MGPAAKKRLRDLNAGRRLQPARLKLCREAMVEPAALRAIRDELDRLEEGLAFVRWQLADLQLDDAATELHTSAVAAALGITSQALNSWARTHRSGAGRGGFVLLGRGAGGRWRWCRQGKAGRPAGP
jgi:hypothetical protein